MWAAKKQELKTSYYRSFVALIVVPILVIIMISIGIIRTMMVEAAIENIKRAQDNVVATLGGDVKDVSLRLSHFVYVNDNEIMKTAAQTDTKDVSKRHHYTQVLTQSFNYAMVPVQDILSAVFFMKNGEYTYMKDDLALPHKDIKATAWYQEALKDKNTVKIGFYNGGVTHSNNTSDSFTIAAGLAPNTYVDRDNRVQMVALFMSSRVGIMIRDYDKEGSLGTTMILDRGGQVLLDRKGSSKLLPEQELKEGVLRQEIQGKEYVYVVSGEPVTGCKIVSTVQLSTLTRDFNQVAGAIVLVTLILFTLFYLFSSYFLRNIIVPIHNTVEGMKEVEGGNLEVGLEPQGQAEMRTMIHSFNHMTRHLKQLMQERDEEQQKKHEAEIRALQSQINPHFLVNSLSSIKFIAQVSKFDSIAKMAEALMKILSCSFRSNAGFYSLKEEIEVLDSFIYLMQIRYSDGFEIEYQLDEDCLDCLVPRLILQPVVENSIVHGFDGREEDLGKILVQAGVQGGFVQIVIEDNGKGMTEEEIRRLLSGEDRESQDNSNIGIYNVNSRLILNYGKACELNMESKLGSYTRTTLRLPVRRGGEDV